METTVKRKTKTPYTPHLNKYQRYEYFKQHIAETSKTHKEYERRMLKIVDRLGI